MISNNDVEGTYDYDSYLQLFIHASVVERNRFQSHQNESSSNISFIFYLPLYQIDELRSKFIARYTPRPGYVHCRGWGCVGGEKGGAVVGWRCF